MANEPADRHYPVPWIVLGFAVFTSLLSAALALLTVLGVAPQVAAEGTAGRAAAEPPATPPATDRYASDPSRTGRVDPTARPAEQTRWWGEPFPRDDLRPPRPDGVVAGAPGDRFPLTPDDRFSPPAGPRSTMAGGAAPGLAGSDPAAYRPVPDPAAYRPAPTTGRHSAGYQRSLLYSGIFGLVVTVVGMTIVGRRRRMW